MRCPDCNKFVGYDDSHEPEVDLEADGVSVTGTARIVLECSEGCGTELKEATFDVSVDLSDEDAELGKLIEDGAEVTGSSVEVDGSEITQRTEGFRIRKLKSGEERKIPVKPRYQRTFYGVSVSYNYKVTVKQEDGTSKDVEGTGVFADEVQASGMEEMV